MKSRDSIEQEIGQKLVWNPNPDAIDKTIGVYRDVDLRDRAKWPTYLDWMAETMERFRKTFGPRVRELDLTASDEEEAEN